MKPVFLSIRVHFPIGLYHGEEWPPAPMRLFQALAAGAGASSGMFDRLPDRVLNALKWLERQTPPMIQADTAEVVSAYKASVPNNSDDISMRSYLAGKSIPDVEKERRKRFNMKLTPRRVVESPITYIWEMQPPALSEASDLIDLANHLNCLGRGIDLACAVGVIGFMEESHQPCWRPLEDGTGDILLRVPVAGSAESLVHRQQTRRRKIDNREFVDPRISFREISYTTRPVEEHRPWALFDLRTVDGRSNFSWRQSDTITIAAMVRHALMANAPPELKGWVSGHPEEGKMLGDRLSWVPLPSLGHRYADGRIRRVLVLGPRNGDGNTFKEAVFPARFATLLKDGNPCALMIEAEAVDPAVAAYFGTSRDWNTVTPIVLPGHMTRGKKQPGRLDLKKTELLVSKALAREGYPSPSEFAVQQTSLFPGSLPSSDYRVTKYMAYPKVHVRVRFDRPVAGPILAGVGRHYGLGLFCKVDVRG